MKTETPKEGEEGSATERQPKTVKPARNPEISNLKKYADYQWEIWTKISEFSYFKSDFFPLEDVTSQNPK